MSKPSTFDTVTFDTVTFDTVTFDTVTFETVTFETVTSKPVVFQAFAERNLFDGTVSACVWVDLGR
jgi:hypothetical protein